MLHIKNRKRLAIAILATFAVVAAAVAVVASRSYSERAIHNRGEKALARLSGCRVSLDGGRIAAVHRARFEKAAFHKDGRILATASPVEIWGDFKPWGDWHIERVAAGRWQATIDLTDAAQAAATASDLIKLISNVTPDTSMDTPSAPAATLEASLTYGDAEPLYFTADLDAVASTNALAFAPESSAAPDAWSFTATQSQLALVAPLDAAEKLAVLVSAQAGAAVLDHVENDAEGNLNAVWNHKGQLVRFANAAGWTVSKNGMQALGLTLPDGELDARITSFESKDGRLTSMTGSVEFACDQIDSRFLSDWLAAIGVDAFREDDAPAYFENVSVAAEFALENSLVTVTPIDDSPALVWSQVNGEIIPLFSGVGQTGAQDILSRAALIELPKEPPAPDESPEPPTDADTLTP